MRLLFCTLLVCIVLASCKKHTDHPYLEGTYKGIFYRHSVYTHDTAQVTLNFSGNKFSGQSSIEQYPAICNGTVSVKNNKANFSNACAWPANFDWTFILDNEYDISTNGDTLRIERGYNGIIFSADRYILIKQK